MPLLLVRQFPIIARFFQEGRISGSKRNEVVPYLSIVIPAYNESQRIPATLNRLQDYLAQQPYSWEIIVVSNGSSDGTAEAVGRVSREVPQISVLDLRERGKGLAAKAGVLQSRGQIVFLADADLSMPPDRLEAFLKALGDADIAIGSREAPGSRRFNESWLRHFRGRVFNWLVQLLAVPGIKDTQCGFKAFRQAAARDLFQRETIKGWGFDVEVLFLAQKRGYTVREIPIDWYFDSDTRVRPVLDTLTMFGDVLLVRWRGLRGRYLSEPSTAKGGNLVR